MSRNNKPGRPKADRIQPADDGAEVQDLDRAIRRAVERILPRVLERHLAARPANDSRAHDDAFLSSDEAARLVGVCAKTLGRLCDREGLPFVRVGRLRKFDRNQILAWLRNRTEGSAQ